MFRRKFISICILLGAMSLTGCAVNRATATVAPDADLSKIKSAYVVKQPKDKNGIDDLIQSNLEKRGYRVTKGPELSGPYTTDVAVTYVDKWMWDITMYMIELTINLRDPKTNFPLASGNSMHTSLSRKSPPEMVDEVIDNVLKAQKQ